MFAVKLVREADLETLTVRRRPWFSGSNKLRDYDILCAWNSVNFVIC